MPAIVRGRLVNAPSAASRAPLTPDQIRLLREGQLQRENLGLRRRIAEMESRLRELETPGAAASAAPGPPSVGAGSLSSPADSPSTASGGHNAFSHLLGAAAVSGGRQERSRQDDPDVLEPFVHVMGAPAVSGPDRPSSPHPRAAKNDVPVSQVSGLPDLPSRKATDLAHADLLTLLPTPPQSMIIVRASLKYMSFLHCSVHIPIFLEEHDEWIKAVSEGRPGGKGDAWLSYCKSSPITI